MDETSQVALDTGDPNEEAAAKPELLSRKLHSLLSQLAKTQRNSYLDRMKIQMALKLNADFTRSSRCQEPPGTQLNPATVEQDFSVWVTIEARYERQSGTPSPDGVLVATLLNIGALQQHLSLNARL